jgi:hypothetical protein
VAENDVEDLLNMLCAEMGFCLSPAQFERLAGSEPNDASAFTDEVFRAEGMDPETADRHLYRQVRDVVTATFAAKNRF